MSASRRLAVAATMVRGDLRLQVDLTLDGSAALVGPNGCGKTTLLDIIAGILEPEAGRVACDDRVLLDTGQAIAVAGRERRIGYVFQDGALFDHLTVWQNLAYPYWARRRKPDEQVEALLDRFGLTSYRDRRPTALSGGERQRLAVARALAAKPAWLLLDEPFAAMDAATRPAVRREVLAALADLAVPALLVTHSCEEALAFADQILVMEHGRVVESGRATELLARPVSAFGAALAGLNRWVGQPVSGGRVRVGELDLAPVQPPPGGDECVLVIAPAEVRLAPGPADGQPNQFTAVVDAVAPDGGRLRVRLGGALPVLASVSVAEAQELALAPGLTLTAWLPQEHLHAL